jgi:hypothetical protein
MDTLPEDIALEIDSLQLLAKIGNIAAHQNIDHLQSMNLYFITRDILSGKKSPSQFVNKISEYLNIPRERSAFIAQEINREIFNSVKDSLKIVHGLAAPAMAKTPFSSAEKILTAQTSAATNQQIKMPAWAGTKVVTPSQLEHAIIAPVASASEQKVLPAVAAQTPANPAEVRPTIIKTPPSPFVEAKTNVVRQSIFEQKLTGTFGLTPSGTQSSTPKTAPPTPPSTTTNFGVADPYREKP